MNNDYLMRQIEEMARIIGRALFVKRQDSHDLFDEYGRFSEGEFLYYRLKKLVLEGKINEAENLLFESIEAGAHHEYLKTALDFYALLGGMDDAQLAAGGFSRQEIAEGLAEVCEVYNVS